MDTYEILVGNVGRVETTNNPVKALAIYGDCKRLSSLGEGRWAGENVTILRNGAVWKEYIGTNSRDDDAD